MAAAVRNTAVSGQHFTKDAGHEIPATSLLRVMTANLSDVGIARTSTTFIITVGDTEFKQWTSGTDITIERRL